MESSEIADRSQLFLALHTLIYVPSRNNKMCIYYMDKMHILYSFLLGFKLIEMEAATPAESARTEDPGLSDAREAAEVLPAESARHNENQHFLLYKNKRMADSSVMRFCMH